MVTFAAFIEINGNKLANADSMRSINKTALLRHDDSYVETTCTKKTNTLVCTLVNKIDRFQSNP